MGGREMGKLVQLNLAPFGVIEVQSGLSLGQVQFQRAVILNKTKLMSIIYVIYFVLYFNYTLFSIYFMNINMVGFKAFY